MDIIEHTDFMVPFLSFHDLTQLRQTSRGFKQWVETKLYPNTHYTWIQKCRLCDPQVLWRIDGALASCYKPVKKKWITAYWQRKLPAMIPNSFWNYFMRIMKGFVSFSHFQQWCSFEQHPLVIPPLSKRWDIGMCVMIVGTSTHNEETDFENLKDMDEFISVGLTLRPVETIHESILGLNDCSIGWHSDDGKIYMDSLVVSEGQPFGHGDEIQINVDYSCGIIMFRKNNRFVHLQELTGDMLSHPLSFSVSCTTMNTLFFTIV